MSSFNKVVVMGNMTRDLELKYSLKGTAIGRITLATNRRWKGEDGQQREEVAFIDIDVFGKAAETLAAHVGKGFPLLVEGRLTLQKWTDKQTGQERSRLGVTLEQFTFIGPPRGRSTTPSSAPNDAPKTDDGPMDDVPF